jgi:hypothetical protein
VPKKIKQLTVRDGKVIAYDERSKRFFLVKLEPLDIGVLEKDEVVEAARFALGDTDPDAVF